MRRKKADTVQCKNCTNFYSGVCRKFMKSTLPLIGRKCLHHEKAMKAAPEEYYTPLGREEYRITSHPGVPVKE